MSANLRAQLMADEGYNGRLYDDGRGKITIGFGRNLTDNGISQAEASIMLDNDIDLVQAVLPIRWPPYAKLDTVRKDVVANMAYNLGIGGLMLFTKMLSHCANGEYDLAAAEMLKSQWANQVGPRAHRLSRQMATGAL